MSRADVERLMFSGSPPSGVNTKPPNSRESTPVLYGRGPSQIRHQAFLKGHFNEPSELWRHSFDAQQRNYALPLVLQEDHHSREIRKAVALNAIKRVMREQSRRAFLIWRSKCRQGYIAPRQSHGHKQINVSRFHQTVKRW